MGYFHEGHLTLMRQAVADGPSVASIFVNSKQFGAGEDFSRYPRDFDRDRTLAEETGIDLLFVPEDDEIYPRGFSTLVDVPQLSALYDGRFRPGHFAGVTTVLSRLFGMIGPQRAYFGQKDYQQTVIVRRMVRDLVIPVEIRVLPTVRESDGLAMSSRNVYLHSRERAEAPRIHAALEQADQLFLEGEKDASRLLGRTAAALSRIPGFRIQYLALTHPETMEEQEEAHPGDVLLTAGFFSQTRLIDNRILGQ